MKLHKLKSRMYLRYALMRIRWTSLDNVVRVTEIDLSSVVVSKWDRVESLVLFSSEGSHIGTFQP